MDAITAIRTRRSIRRYTDQPVPEPLIELILRAAMAAPSACNQQAWEFVVIDDRETIQEIPRFNSAAAPLKTAPLAIVVCGNVQRELPLARGFWVQDCSAAIQNLLLAAHASGLGAVWLGGYPIQHLVEKMQALLGLPGEVIPLAVIAIGYPAQRIGPEDRFDPHRVHLNRWQEQPDY
jgi:nitroreductase